LLLTQIYILRNLRHSYDKFLDFRKFPLSGNNQETALEATTESKELVLANEVFEKLLEIKNSISGTWKEVSNALEIPQSTITRIKNLLEGKGDIASYEMLTRIKNKLKG
jgi:hypothetical protein